MKRAFKKYSTNKTARTFGWVMTVAGVFLLTSYFYAKSLLDELGEVSWVEVLFLIPALIHALLQAILEALVFVGLSAGAPCFIGGIVLLILTASYKKRMDEVKFARRVNGGKLPGELLWEMYQSGEFDDAEYQRELSNNLKLTEMHKKSGLTDDYKMGAAENITDEESQRMKSNFRKSEMLSGAAKGAAAVIGAIVAGIFAVIGAIVLIFLLLYLLIVLS